MRTATMAFWAVVTALDTFSQVLERPAGGIGHVR